MMRGDTLFGSAGPVKTVLAVVFALVVTTMLSACGGSIDPERRPLPKDYEPPPIDGFPSTKPPSRI